MNYLTHFLKDHHPQRPLYNFGLALPDLVNVAQRGWKPMHDIDTETAAPAALEIWHGYRQHIKGDAGFHNLPLFTENSKRLRLELENHGLVQPGIRLFFVAHILVEMLIDRHIVKNRPETAGLFYDHLDTVTPDDTLAFFTAAGSPVPERFHEFLNRFRESRYLYGYAQDEGLFYSVNRLLQRTRQPAFPDAMQPAFAALVHSEEEKLYDAIEGFLRDGL